MSLSEACRFVYILRGGGMLVTETVNLGGVSLMNIVIGADLAAQIS